MKQPERTPESPLPLADILSGQILPSFRHEGLNRLAVARAHQASIELPAGVTITPKKVRSARTKIKGPRMIGNSSLITARWAEDHLEITRAPALSFVVSGVADMHFGEYVMSIPQGFAVMIPPGVPHPDGHQPHLEGSRLKDGSCDIFTLALRGGKIQCWMCFSRGHQHIGPGRGQNIFVLSERVAQYLDALNDELVHARNEYHEIGNGLLQALLLTLRREIQDGHLLHLHSGMEEKPHPADGFNAIERTQEYMRSHLNEQLTIESVARTIYMSRAQFAKKFHEQTGQTFTEYLNSIRLEQAQTFLRETDWNMTHIAEFVGFKSVSYFHRLFRSKVGVSPIEYRRTHRSA